jgi:hypothetical protein
VLNFVIPDLHHFIVSPEQPASSGYDFTFGIKKCLQLGIQISNTYCNRDALASLPGYHPED